MFINDPNGYQTQSYEGWLAVGKRRIDTDG